MLIYLLKRKLIVLNTHNALANNPKYISFVAIRAPSPLISQQAQHVFTQDILNIFHHAKHCIVHAAWRDRSEDKLRDFVSAADEPTIYESVPQPFYFFERRKRHSHIFECELQECFEMKFFSVSIEEFSTLMFSDLVSRSFRDGKVGLNAFQALYARGDLSLQQSVRSVACIDHVDESG